MDVLPRGMFLFSSPDLKPCTTRPSPMCTSSDVMRSYSHVPTPPLDTPFSSSIVISKAAVLPTEIVQHVYAYLGPTDFNAARHTCHTWMVAALHRPLLVTMVKRGGWWSSMNCDKTWPLSCSLARECALGSNWTGNGLTTAKTWSRASTLSFKLPPSGVPIWTQVPDSNAKPNPFSLTGRVDFSNLTSGYFRSQEKSVGSLVFTASVCGKFLLVAEGGLIYVYELVGSDLCPLTSVICPRRVLAMSMDTSSKRFAVAALLDGRMGLICDLQIGKERALATTSTSHDKIVVSTAGSRDDLKPVSFIPEYRPQDERVELPESSTCLNNVNTSSTTDSEDLDPIEFRDGLRHTLLLDTNTAEGRERNVINRTWNLKIPHHTSLFARSNDSSWLGIPIETGPRSLFRNLCSEDDPPRSVAICPQRQCVAFGCSAGLELHWVDAITGHDLNRWFPLTGPSDHLYFLPPRPGVDSPRKLRLISSAAHPSQRSALNRKFYTAKPYNTFWDTIGVEARIPSFAGFVSDCDHYRAVPMSDGFHILFSDPDSGMLCLGSDARGDPRRLLRKVMFPPPEKGIIPRLYAAGTNLATPRIVAAYGDKLVLFSIPSDVFELSKKEQQPAGVTMADMYAASQWLDWWPQADISVNHPKLVQPTFDGPTASGVKPVWPLFIRGAVIGVLEGLVDIVVNEVDGLSIWGLAVDGKAAIWQIDAGQMSKTVQHRTIQKDGRVVDVPDVDVDDDLVMLDEDTLEWSAGFDGYTSASQSPPVKSSDDEFEFCIEDVDVRPGTWYDEDGDVVMVDATPPVEIQKGSLHFIARCRRGSVDFDPLDSSFCDLMI